MVLERRDLGLAGDAASKWAHSARYEAVKAFSRLPDAGGRDVHRHAMQLLPHGQRIDRRASLAPPHADPEPLAFAEVAPGHVHEERHAVPRRRRRRCRTAPPTGPCRRRGSRSLARARGFRPARVPDRGSRARGPAWLLRPPDHAAAASRAGCDWGGRRASCRARSRWSPARPPARSCGRSAHRAGSGGSCPPSPHARASPPRARYAGRSRPTSPAASPPARGPRPRAPRECATRAGAWGSRSPPRPALRSGADPRCRRRHP